MNLNQLQHFVAVADNGSVRVAAQLLNISQPAISRSLRALEDTLGVALFVRDARGSALTEFGKVLHERARLIVNEIDRIPDDIAELAGAPAGRVRIACSATLGLLVMPQVLDEFHSRYPQVELHVVGGLPGSHFASLLDGSLDMVLGPRPRTDLPDAIASWQLFEVGNALTVRRGHPLCTATSLRDFADAEWVLSTAASGVTADLQAAFRSRGMAGPNVAVRADSLYLVQALVAETNYVSLIPRSLLNAMNAAGGLQTVDVPEFDSKDSVELFYCTHRKLSRSAMPLANAIRIAGKLMGARTRE